jgi:hypothetical protein
MTIVNPPSFVRIPQKLLDDPQLRDYFEARDHIQYQLWLRSGGGDDLTEKIVSGEQQSSPALTFKLNQRIGTGDPLTWDDTGFTWDNTRLTFDRTEY